MPLVKPIIGSNPPLVMCLESLTKRDVGKVQFEVRPTDINGATLFIDRVDLTSARSRTQLLNNINRLAGMALPLTDAMLVQVYTEFVESQARPTAGSEFFLILRRLTEENSQGTRIEVGNPPTPEAVRAAVRRALDEVAIGSPNMVLTWASEHADKLMVLDVDYHHLPSPPSEDFTTALAAAIRPRPFAWWRSHGGGLHFVYVAVPPYDANELVACAALAITQIDPTATIDLLTETRHPKSERLRSR